MPGIRALALADAPPHAPIPELVAACDPQLILLLGDLEPAWTDGLAEVDLPKLGVRGNHDSSDALGAVGAEDLHLRTRSCAGLTFAGFSGSPGYDWTEAEAKQMLTQLPPADVLLTHSPPAGVNDDPDDHVHRGSQALREWVEAHQPRLLLHGHTLPNPMRCVEHLGPTRVIHVRGALPVELP